MNEHKRRLLFLLAIVFGVSLIIGATRNLPASAQGLVTGRSTILVERLTDRVGRDALTRVALEADLLGANPWLVSQLARANDGRHNSRRERRNPQVEGAVDDQLERIGPVVVYQVAVDAGLLTQAEAERMLRE